MFCGSCTRAITKVLRANLLLFTFALILGWSALRFGGVLAEDWNYALLALGILLVLCYLPLDSGALAAPPDWSLYLCVAALPLLAALQLIPLPLSLLHLVSPSREAITRAILPFDGTVLSAPLSLRPAATRLEVFHLIGYAAAFLVARDLMWRFPRGQWRVAAPLLVVAAMEAGLGLIQDTLNANNVFPSGTFVNRDHFSSLLEMTLPFAAGGMVEYWSRTFRRPLLACTLAAGGAVLLAAIAVALSRSGFLIALGSLAVLGVIQAKRRFRGFRRVVGLATGGVALVGAIIVLATPQLLGRFADFGGIAGMGQESRWRFWREAWQVVLAFPLTGCGFGAFVSCIAPYRYTAPTRTLDYAHNAPLHLAAEGGVVVLGVAVAGVLLLWRRLNQAWPSGARRAELPLACALSLLAGLGHSLVDFNLSIPACALAFSWVAGMTAGLRFSPPVPTHRPLALTREVLDQFRR
jgi:O-antigen ligase